MVVSAVLLMTYALPISAERLAKTGIVAKEVPEEINQCDRGQRKN